MAHRCACMRRPLMRACVAAWCSVLRRCATTPSVDEVRAAYRVLGVNTRSSYADVKKRYAELAMQHHPDVATATARCGDDAGNSDRMVDINNAYSTVTRFHKSGQALPTAHRATPGGGDDGADVAWARYAAAAGANTATYTPWHEDIDPMMYEMMWDEMRQRCASASACADDAYATGDVGDAAYMYMYYPHDAGRGHDNGNRRRSYYSAGRHGNAQQCAGHERHAWRKDSTMQRNGYGASTSSKQDAQPASSASTSSSDNTNTNGSSNNGTSGCETFGKWCDADVQAMVHMYKDGKSFDFIANALGKEATHVVHAFNLWSEQQQQQQQQQQRRVRSRRSHNHPTRRGVDAACYYAESPDDIPFELYASTYKDAGYNNHYNNSSVCVDDDVNPYGYYVNDDVYRDMCDDARGASNDGGTCGDAYGEGVAMPYQGRNFMHRSKTSTTDAYGGKARSHRRSRTGHHSSNFARYSQGDVNSRHRSGSTAHYKGTGRRQ